MSNAENNKSNNPLQEHQWKKGQSGNPKGRPKGTSIERAIKDLLEDGIKGDDIQKALARVAIQKAMGGDFKFYQMVLERIDGKVVDKVENDTKMDIVVKYEDYGDSRDNSAEAT